MEKLRFEYKFFNKRTFKSTCFIIIKYWYIYFNFYLNRSIIRLFRRKSNRRFLLVNYIKLDINNYSNIFFSSFYKSYITLPCKKITQLKSFSKNL